MRRTMPGSGKADDSWLCAGRVRERRQRIERGLGKDREGRRISKAVCRRRGNVEKKVEGCNGLFCKVGGWKVASTA